MNHYVSNELLYYYYISIIAKAYLDIFGLRLSNRACFSRMYCKRRIIGRVDELLECLCEKWRCKTAIVRPETSSLDYLDEFDLS